MMTKKWYEELGITDSYYADNSVCIVHGDSREQSLLGISAVATDPPYELGFMGKSWDSKGVSFQKETWEKIRSYCLPGSLLLSFGGSRTQHRIACAIEDAGWEIRDTLMWVYGSGFPKSLDIGKAIDKAKGATREVVGEKTTPDGKSYSSRTPNSSGEYNKTCAHNSLSGETRHNNDLTAPATLEAQLWDGYGTALKPAYEPIILAMNPLDKTFANSALKYGVAGLNIDECRVPTTSHEVNARKDKGNKLPTSCSQVLPTLKNTEWSGSNGRFPTNFLHDGSEEVLELFPNAGGGFGTENRAESKGRYGTYSGSTKGKVVGYGDGHGSAARFFYCAKASRSERSATNNHPTVKPLALMTYLCKLVKMPEYNIILDPFCGSGTTLLACLKLGIRVIGIDSDEQSCEIAAIRYLKSQAEMCK